MKLKKLIVMTGLAAVLAYPMMSDAQAPSHLGRLAGNGIASQAEPEYSSMAKFAEANLNSVAFALGDSSLFNAYVSAMGAMGNSDHTIKESMTKVKIAGTTYIAVDEAKFHCYEEKTKAHVVKAKDVKAFKAKLAKLSQEDLVALDQVFVVDPVASATKLTFSGFAAWSDDQAVAFGVQKAVFEQAE